MAKNTGQKKLPALQFYPGDWKKDIGVQSLDYHDRGVWFELLLSMHESRDRGRLAYPNGAPMGDDAVAKLLGISEAEWKQTRSTLEDRGVLDVDDTGALVNRRMARDERVRRAKIAAGRKGGSASKREAGGKQTRSKGPSKTQAKRGSSVSSSSSDDASRAKQDAPSNETSTINPPSAAAVGFFLEATGSSWRLESPIPEWARGIEAEPKYSGVDIPYEIRKAAEWHQGQRKVPKAPDISIRNWLEKARPDPPRNGGDSLRLSSREEIERFRDGDV